MRFERSRGNASEFQGVSLGVGDERARSALRDRAMGDERRQIRRGVCAAEIAEVGDTELQHIVVRPRGDEAVQYVLSKSRSEYESLSSRSR